MDENKDLEFFKETGVTLIRNKPNWKKAMVDLLSIADNMNRNKIAEVSIAFFEDGGPAFEVTVHQHYNILLLERLKLGEEFDQTKFEELVRDLRKIKENNYGKSKRYNSKDD